jgi:hypothetical protein
VRQFDVSRDSLYRHLTNHLRPALQQAAQELPEFDAVSLAIRLADIANDARQARVMAYAAGNAHLGARLGSEEIKALSVLADRFHYDHDSGIDRVRELQAMADAAVALIRRAPRVGVLLAKEIEAVNGPRELVDALKKAAVRAQEARTATIEGEVAQW